MEVSQRFGVVLVLLLSLAVSTAAQSPPLYPNQTPGPEAQTAASSEPPQRQTSWKLLAPDILHDQKQIWLFPASVAHGKHWIPTAGLVLATVGLVALDPHDDPYFRRTQRFSRFNQSLSSRNTIVAMTLVPLSTYALGLARRNSYSQETVELAAEGVLDAEIPALVMKDITRRLRPRDTPPNSDFSDTWFRSKGPFYSSSGGFPSGHTVAAFSIATVFAERYRRHRWVPWVSYGLAGLVGFSRITLQAHFPSDVFAGAVLGYTITHYAVLRRP